MSVIDLKASRKPKSVTRIAADVARQGAPKLIVQRVLIQSTLAPSVFGVLHESAGLLGYAVGFGVTLVLSPISRPELIRQPRPSAEGRTNIIRFPDPKRQPSGQGQA
jgi:hypothetical protein